MGFTFVHASDLHLDRPFRGLGTLPEGPREILRDASLGALDRLVDVCLERQARFLLLAGDLTWPGSLRARLALREALERLVRAGVEVFLVESEDDVRSAELATEFGEEALDVPAGVHVLRGGQRGHVADDQGSVLAEITGWAAGESSLDLDLAGPLASESDGRLRIGLLHADVATHSDVAAGDRRASTRDRLLATERDYWALGSHHAPSELIVDGRHLVYPGTTQGRGPHFGELGERGVRVVEVSDPGRLDSEFVPTARVVLVSINLVADRWRTPIDAAREVEETEARLLGESSEVFLIVRPWVAVEGPGTPHEDWLRHAIQVQRSRSGGNSPRGIWWLEPSFARPEPILDSASSADPLCLRSELAGRARQALASMAPVDADSATRDPGDASPAQAWRDSIRKRLDRDGLRRYWDPLRGDASKLPALYLRGVARAASALDTQVPELPRVDGATLSQTADALSGDSVSRESGGERNRETRAAEVGEA